MFEPIGRCQHCALGVACQMQQELLAGVHLLPRRAKPVAADLILLCVELSAWLLTWDLTLVCPR